MGLEKASGKCEKRQAAAILLAVFTKDGIRQIIRSVRWKEV